MPASIFDLGIGPIINASWVLSGLMLLKPLGLATQIKELQRNGREVRSKPQLLAVGVHYSWLRGGRVGWRLISQGWVCLKLTVFTTCEVTLTHVLHLHTHMRSQWS